MENHEELWMQYMKQRTENSRDFFNKTGFVFGAGIGPGAAMIANPMFGMMMASTMTGVYDCRTLVAPVPTVTENAAPKYPNLMLNLWDMALNKQ